MDLDEVEETVRTAAASVGGLVVAAAWKDGYLDLEIRRSPADGTPSRPDEGAVRIWTNGVEVFFLSVPGGFGLQEFEYEQAGQAEVLRLLVDLAAEYLTGRSSVGDEPRRWGRRRPYVEISTGGATFRLRRR